MTNLFEMAGFALLVIVVYQIVSAVHRFLKRFGVEQPSKHLNVSLQVIEPRGESPEESLVAVLHFDQRYPERFVDLVEAILERPPEEFSEVVVLLDSPGGSVTTFGLCLAHMERLRGHAKRLVVCADEYLASGGYLMALPAHHIIAAPFAMVGNMGVVIQVPNFSELAKKLGVSMRVITAGRHKRPVHPFDTDDRAARAHLQTQADRIHEMMRDVLNIHRPKVDADTVLEADIYTGIRAQQVGLIDQVTTSRDYLFGINLEFRLCHFVHKRHRGGLAGMLSEGSARFAAKILAHLLKF